MIDERLDRLEIVIGEDGVKALKSKKVIVFGVGGVGGYVCEFLVRSGIENLTIVDFDVISQSNLNRQIVALASNVGCAKVDEMKKRLLSINPQAEITAINEKLLDNCEYFELKDYDYIIDAIDNVTAKVNLIKYCSENGLNLICSLGTGNRFGAPNFKICDIFETRNDVFASKMRNLLRKENITRQTVCFCEVAPQKSTRLGSSVQFPCAAACCITGYVMEQLIKEDK